MSRKTIAISLLAVGAALNIIHYFLLSNAFFAILLTEIILLLGQGFAEWPSLLSLPLYLLCLGIIAPSAMFFEWTLGSLGLLAIGLVLLAIVFFGWRMLRRAELPSG